MKLNYKLNNALLEEYYGYLAMHDAKIQKKMVTLTIGIISSSIVLTILVFDLTIFTLIISLICLVFVIYSFPKLYWNMVFHKVNQKVNKLNLDYKNMNIEIKEKSFYIESDKNILIYDNEVQRVKFTKNCCLIFYQYQTNIDTLIIPINAINSLDNFLRLLEEKKLWKKS